MSNVNNRRPGAGAGTRRKGKGRGRQMMRESTSNSSLFSGYGGADTGSRGETGRLQSRSFMLSTRRASLRRCPTRTHRLLPATPSLPTFSPSSIQHWHRRPIMYRHQHPVTVLPPRLHRHLRQNRHPSTRAWLGFPLPFGSRWSDRVGVLWDHKTRRSGTPSSVASRSRRASAPSVSRGALLSRPDRTRADRC